ncbi:phytoene desaturase family protein [Blastococcus atacamensis]|uniref:phytoene desaturase family protein n=1 Tax=Blastococcus atacamensis TaxID=2070508 RepID=UPI000CEBB695|nr:NAD(P)/FAD-dependent oxidoreductase [Blastococcus atacamensis]
MPLNEFDVVVVGAGVNGMVAAAELAGAGRRVCLVEANERIGGFVASGELTVPGYVHDTFSSWHPLFLTGGAYAALGEALARHGLEYRNTDDRLCASVAEDGRTTMAYRDPARTVEGFAHAGDRAAYLAMLERLGADIQAIGGLMGQELRSPAAVRSLLDLARRNGLAGMEQWARDTASSGRAAMERQFTGPEVDHLWAPWLLHGGLAPDSASGGLMVALFAATMHGAGLPVVRGGAGRFVTAFEGLLAEREVEVRTGTVVDRVLVEDGRAVGVRAGESTLTAREAVLASVWPGVLYDQLLPVGAVRAGLREEAVRYRPGRAAMQVHVALSGPVPWRDDELAGVPLIHLSDGSSSTAIACAEASAGMLPARPTVVVGQQHVLDPSRVPAGAAALWLQLQEVPFRPVGDSAGELDVSSGWSPTLVDGYVDRVLHRIERQAPGLRERVLGVRALSPVDLQAANRNAVDGDPYEGSQELDQNLLWRPGPLTSRHRTEVPGLWHIGASTHPGAGLGAGSGHLVAQEILRPPGLLSRLLPAGTAARKLLASFRS